MDVKRAVSKPCKRCESATAALVRRVGIGVARCGSSGRFEGGARSLARHHIRHSRATAEALATAGPGARPPECSDDGGSRDRFSTARKPCSYDVAEALRFREPFVSFARRSVFEPVLPTDQLRLTEPCRYHSVHQPQFKYLKPDPVRSAPRVVNAARVVTKRLPPALLPRHRQKNQAAVLGRLSMYPKPQRLTLSDRLFPSKDSYWKRRYSAQDNQICTIAQRLGRRPLVSGRFRRSGPDAAVLANSKEGIAIVLSHHHTTGTSQSTICPLVLTR